MASTKSILLIGATGVIGRHLLNSVIASKAHFQRIAILTSQNTITNKADLVHHARSEGVDVIAGDLSKESDVKNAYQGVDTVVSSVGRDMLLGQISLIQWACETGVKRFFPSEFGTDVAYNAKSKTEKSHQAKLKVRAAIEDSSLEYTYIVVGPFPESFLNSKLPPPFGWWDPIEKHAILLGDGEGKVSFTAAPDVGKLLVAALLHPQESRNRALKLNSFTTTPHQILAEFERQTQSKWTVEYTPLEKLRQLEEDAHQHGHFQASLMTLRRIWTEGGTQYEKIDNDLIEAPAMDTLENQVRQRINSTRL